MNFCPPAPFYGRKRWVGFHPSGQKFLLKKVRASFGNCADDDTGQNGKY